MRSLKYQGGWIASAIGIGLSLIGSSKDADAQKAYGAAALARGKEQNEFNKLAAIQAEAVGQIEVFEIERQADLVASRAVAVAAAGGYAGDITNLIADIEGEGLYRMSLAMYESATEAETLRHEGRLAEKYGSDTNVASGKKARATTLSGYGNAISGIGKIIKDYG